jgi:hypothetical protein
VDEKNSLAGPIIEIYSEAQRLEVFGAGAMKGVQQEKSTDVPRPVDVTWARGLIVDGKGNTVDVSGQVVAVSTDEKGAVNTAKGEHVKMLLADVAPTTKPSEKIATTQATEPPNPKVAASQPTSKPSRSSQYAGMSNKAIRKVTFTDNANARISSVTMAGDGSLLRRIHLEAPVVEHDMVAKKMVIPVAGRMVVEDHVDPKDKGAGAGSEAMAAKGAFGGAEAPRGSTAFQWTQSFTYDDAAQLAVMTGSDDRPVIIAHRDDSEQARTFHLTGQVVTAEMEQVEVPTTKPATAPATRPVEKKVQLKRVTANGRLTFAGPGVNVQAKELEFDPKSNLVTARGDGRSPVIFDIASSPGGQKSAESIQYDIKTGRLVNATRVNVRLNR